MTMAVGFSGKFVLSSGKIAFTTKAIFCLVNFFLSFQVVLPLCRKNVRMKILSRGLDIFFAAMFMVI